ncbi:MAG: glyoxylate/hydroxypyruvate reductase A [Paracoccaceae bacterium]|nr:glyoxylate/hydroxypyruvate reductase A [Paracoccaceae bacterium]
MQACDTINSIFGAVKLIRTRLKAPYKRSKNLMTHRIPFTGRVNEDAMLEWIKLINNNLTGVKIVPLGELSSQEKAQVDCVIVVNPDPAVLESLPNLKWIQSLWAGVERLLAEYSNEEVSIVRLIDPQLSKTMSEGVLAWSFFLHRAMPTYLAQQASEEWTQHDLPTPQERTIGVLGLGKLGKAAAVRLKKNEFNVVGWSRSKAEIDGVETFHGKNGLSRVLEKSDILVVLLPLSSATEGLLDAENIARMKSGASIINFGRGPIINDEALIKALDSRHLGHAVLDVFAVEPLPKGHQYWSHSSVTVLPHCSAPTNKKTSAIIAAKNISDFVSNGVVPASADRKLGY